MGKKPLKDMNWQELNEAYNKQVKSGGPVFLNAAIVNRVDEIMQQVGGRREAVLNAAGIEDTEEAEGLKKEKADHIRSCYVLNYTHFSSLTPFEQAIVATNFYNIFAGKIQKENRKFKGDPFSLENPKVQEYLDRYCMDPAFRLAVTMMSNMNGRMGWIGRRYDRYMNKLVMERTLSAPDRDPVNNLYKEYGAEKAKQMIQKNAEQNAKMAALFLCAHCGNNDCTRTYSR